MFNRAKRDVQLIAARAKQGTSQEMCLARNVTSSSAQKLQELSVQFRKQQAEYLRRTCVCKDVFTRLSADGTHTPDIWLRVRCWKCSIVSYWSACVYSWWIGGPLGLRCQVAQVCALPCDSSRKLWQLLPQIGSASVIEDCILKDYNLIAPRPPLHHSGLRARDELLMSHELKPEVTGVDEEEAISESELLYDIVSGEPLSSILVLTCWHQLWETHDQGSSMCSWYFSKIENCYVWVKKYVP